MVYITDSKCDLIATYTYDEWGKLLSIETAEENNSEQLKVAEINPLRYRGYYYDNETGYYYLQSRYYDPDLGRFISADDFSYVDTSHKLNVNAYSYCWNSPIALEDAEGTTPQISIDLSALQPLVEDATTVIKAGLNKFAENIKKLISRYNDFLDKLEFNINHPDVVINNGLSKILGREVSIKFPLINAIRAYFGTFDIRTGELVGGAGDGYHTNDSDNEENGIAPYYIINDDEKTDNWFLATLKSLVFAIEAFPFTQIFDALVQLFKLDKNLSKCIEDIIDFFEDLTVDIVTIINTFFLKLGENMISDISDSLSDYIVGEINGKILGDELSLILDIFDVFGSIDENFDGAYSIEYSFITTVIDIFCFVLCFLAPEVIVGVDFVNDFIKKSLNNIETGRLWG